MFISVQFSYWTWVASFVLLLPPFKPNEIVKQHIRQIFRQHKPIIKLQKLLNNNDLQCGKCEKPLWSLKWNVWIRNVKHEVLDVKCKSDQFDILLALLSWVWHVAHMWMHAVAQIIKNQQLNTFNQTKEQRQTKSIKTACRWFVCFNRRTHTCHAIQSNRFVWNTSVSARNSNSHNIDI